VVAESIEYLPFGPVSAIDRPASRDEYDYDLRPQSLMASGSESKSDPAVRNSKLKTENSKLPERSHRRVPNS